jgi:hypothetical protein
MIGASQPGKPALDLCEEAVHLLRRAPLALLAIYYLGSVPFILALLFFWADMSSSATAREHTVPAALGMAVAYLWMLTWQAIFARGLRRELAGGASALMGVGAWFRIAALQAAVQPWKLVALPVAAGLLVPFPELYAFFHNASVSDSTSMARKLARLWPRENMTFLAILSLLSVVVFLNVGTGVVVLPYLLKMLLGLDTVFTRSPYTFLNTTFLAIAGGLSYLVLNPFVKAFYVLRCFYGESLTTAEDLRFELKVSTAALACVLALLGAFSLPAQEQDLPSRLDQSIDRVLQSPEYAWRLPRTPHLDDRNGNWFVRNTLYLLQATDRGLKQLGRWIDDLAQWLGDRFGKRLPPLPEESKARAPATQLRVTMVLLLAIITGVVAYLLWRFLAASRAQPRVAPIAAPVAVDLGAEDVHADQQQPDEWLAMAQASLGRQDYRLAMRALYLAGLSALAGEKLISLDRSKSDLDYQRELRRRARQRPALLAAFTENRTMFERGWYGMYDVDLATIHQFETNLEQMRPRAQQ